MKMYTLLGRDGKHYTSTAPGTLGGHKKNRVYGRLSCRGARQWLAKGYYVKHRVFFADESTAIAAGYRPCAGCMPERSVLWEKAVQLTSTRVEALELYRIFLEN
jgi:methylphosphotriester-DNA--protein-cysteine methyltransferase